MTPARLASYSVLVGWLVAQQSTESFKVWGECDPERREKALRDSDNVAAASCT